MLKVKMKIKEILIEARSIISDEKNWTQGDFARDENGDPVAPDRPWAVCFCSMGAVARAFEQFTKSEQTGATFKALILRDAALDALSVELKCHTIASFNDNSTHQEVLALFDKAIANCQ